MQAAKPPNQLMARPQIKMICVRKDDFRAKLFERLLGKCFDGSLRADGQKKRRLHYTVWRGQAATARAGRIGFQDFKRKTHPLSLSEENPRHHGKQQNERVRRTEGDAKRLTEWRLLRVRRGKSNCY